jgi:cell division protein FtsI (penicillin-binding protein 3)
MMIHRALLRRAPLALSLFVLAACASTPEPAPSAPHTSGSEAPPAPAPAQASSAIDARMQAIADEELDRAMAEAKAEEGAVLVLDPASGEILANAGRAGGARFDVAVGRAYVTGSTLKTLVLAAALDEGVIALSDRFDCEQGKRSYGERVLHDASPNGVLTVPEMLATSTNVGFSKIFDRLGSERLVRWLRRFHLGAAPAIPGAATGELPPPFADGSFEGGVLASGEWLRASPLQMAAAYAAIANDGVYVSPTLTRRTGAPPRETIMKPETARAVRGALGEVVYGERGTGKQARVEGARVVGKTGTGEWTTPSGAEVVYASFIGLLPAERARYVILVGIENPGKRGYTGGTIAAPTFARVASRLLALR